MPTTLTLITARSLAGAGRGRQDAGVEQGSALAHVMIIYSLFYTLRFVSRVMIWQKRTDTPVLGSSMKMTFGRSNR
jgi:hypothetical protein